MNNLKFLLSESDEYGYHFDIGLFSYHVYLYDNIEIEIWVNYFFTKLVQGGDPGWKKCNQDDVRLIRKYVKWFKTIKRDKSWKLLRNQLFE